MRLRNAAIMMLVAGAMTSMACATNNSSSTSQEPGKEKGGTTRAGNNCWKRWPRPQGIGYRGTDPSLDVETVEYVYGLDASARTARVHFVDPTCADDAITLSSAGTYPVGDGRVELFHVTNPAGNDLCRGQSYEPTSRERILLGCQPTGLCPAVAALQGVAMLVPGAWRDGAWSMTRGDDTVHTLSCVTGATAKCALWGYIPGRYYQGTELSPYYQACVQAARAMYTSGDTADFSYTCPNTEVEIYDRLNIQRRQTADFPLESLWSDSGLVCMHHARYQRCESRLGTLMSGTCVDPAPQPGVSWSSTADPRALIAVGSPTSYDIGKCPTHDCTRDLASARRFRAHTQPETDALRGGHRE